MSNKKVILMRGISGAGKSTHINNVILPTVNSNESVVTVSADHWFEKDDGVYKFDPGQLPAAHASSQENFKKALISGVNLVIVDNTNLALFELKPYIHMAEEYGYDWSIHQIEAENPQNVHGVPSDKVLAMKQKMDRAQLPDEWKRRIKVFKR